MPLTTKPNLNIWPVLKQSLKFFSFKEVYLNEIRGRWGRELKTYRSRSDNALLHSLTRSDDESKTVNDSTWHDLDMDALYDRLDGNTTPIGRQYLYRQLRTYEPCEKKLQLQYSTSLHFQTDHAHREDVQLNMWLLRSSNASAITNMLFGSIPKGDFPRALAWCLAGLSLASIMAALIWPVLLWLPLFPMLANFIFSETYAHKIDRHSMSFVYLRNLITAACRLSSMDAKNISQLEYLKRNRQRLRQLRGQFRIVGLDSSSANPLTAQCAFFLNVLCLFDFLIFMRCSSRLVEHKEKLRDIYSAIASTDSAISVASYLTYNLGVCNPQFGCDEQIYFECLTHPLLENSVPNDYISNQRSTLITGSNMAGKSTFIKAIGTNLILAQALWFCHARVAVVQQASVMSSIKRSDSLKEGKSYYFAEIEALLQLMEASDNDHPHIFLIDEILHGTNTVERIACSAAILDRLSYGNTVLVTSHDIELCRLLSSRYRSFHFSETGNLDNMFDYKLRAGHSITRNAITLLESIGFPSDVITDARKIAGDIGS